VVFDVTSAFSINLKIYSIRAVLNITAVYRVMIAILVALRKALSVVSGTCLCEATDVCVFPGLPTHIKSAVVEILSYE
jgi:hypothetical protein